jgi:hypothetical protein
VRPISAFLSSRPYLSYSPPQDCKNDKSSNINIDLIDNSPFHLRGSFEGPQGTPYEGGHFEVVRFTYPPLTLAAPWSPCNAHPTTAGHCNPRILSLPTREDEIHYEGLSSEHILRLRRHLP